jgi:hypothetical protein
LKIPKEQSKSYFEGHTTQWPKEIEQNDKQRSTKHYAETKKSLKISNGKAASVNWRRTDNTIAKRKRSNNDGEFTTHKI